MRTLITYWLKLPGLILIELAKIAIFTVLGACLVALALSAPQEVSALPPKGDIQKSGCNVR